MSAAAASTPRLRAQAAASCRRERKQRQRIDTKIRRGLDHAAHRLDASRWPAERGKARAARPAAVAIHDDGDVQALMACILLSGGPTADALSCFREYFAL